MKPLYRVPLTQEERDQMTPEEAFWLYVDEDPNGECWVWRGSRQREYGRYHAHGKTHRAHRYAYFLAYGVLLGDAVACHTCDNPPCVRPDHIFEGTYNDNNRDRARKGRSSSGDRHWTRSQPERVRRGHEHPMAKYTPEQIAEVKRLVDEGGKTLNMIAEETGVKKFTVSKIKRGIQWTKE